MSSFLIKLGLVVIQASSGTQLLDKLAHAGPFDLIVTDISMPRMTGVQALQLARSVGVQAPVIVMTALRDADLAEQIEALGPAVLLHKPFTRASLCATVERVLRMEKLTHVA